MPEVAQQNLGFHNCLERTQRGTTTQKALEPHTQPGEHRLTQLFARSERHVKKLLVCAVLVLLPQLGAADPPRKPVKVPTKAVKSVPTAKSKGKKRTVEFHERAGEITVAVREMPSDVSSTAARPPEHKVLIRPKGNFNDALLRSGGAQ